VKESKMQEKIRDHALKGKWKGYVECVKLTMLAMYGQAGYPDLCFFAKGCYNFLIEVKKPGEEPTPLQAERIRILKSLGFPVHVCDSVEEGKEAVDLEMEMARRKVWKDGGSWMPFTRKAVIKKGKVRRG